MTGSGDIAAGAVGNKTAALGITGVLGATIGVGGTGVMIGINGPLVPVETDGVTGVGVFITGTRGTTLGATEIAGVEATGID